MTQAQAPEQRGPTLSPPVTLDEPIVRGEQKITEVRVRKPRGGELRGVNLLDVAQLDTDSLIKVLPRITLPGLLKHEVETMDLSDLMALGAELSGFLPQRARRAAYQDG